MAAGADLLQGQAGQPSRFYYRIDQLTGATRHQLDRIQRQPALITGFPGQTGLTLEPEPPANQIPTFQAL